ncbi:MAG: tRNA (adenosine(37)-N6)-threonylcarbamoyltransferase complex dimerization subunit type 1 TsaB [Candidatus Nomurabacteria bacterium]|jgi:tRNA threonylcarbamoyl adenosine modification protein YeaZ|nr:tRNA (adenosine(37)-N6)-threonylcarbamoyltransferase complex dimerization subunit type 1 TsaB [Candidatus Nomurabacteria bacterium]
MILAIKTAEVEAELYLVDLDSSAVLATEKWTAGRELLDGLLTKIQDLLTDVGFSQLSGLIVFTGPGSFTGLRIGISTMNAIAYAEKIPIVGATGVDWLKVGLGRLRGGADDKLVMPEYGGEANISTPKK